MKKFIYALIVLVTMIPLTCGYIMTGGIISEWIGRVDELTITLKNGGFLLFPSEELLVSQGALLHSMNSNLWFILSAVLVRMTGSFVLAWECYMIFIHVLTFVSAVLFFGRLFETADSGYPAFFGVLFYLTSPYRLYVCYDLADMTQAAVWAVLPLYLWAVMGIVKKKDRMLHLAAAALALAAIGYADLMQMLTIAGLTLFMALICRKFFLLVPVVAGSLLSLPCILRLVSYLFRGGFENLGIPLDSIMGKGYVPGEFFSIFVFRNGHPGLGLGIGIGLLSAIWLIFVKSEKIGSARKEAICFTALSVFLTLLSLQSFPWEFVQRLGVWALKLVALFGTPAVFFGMAQIGFCVPAALAMGQMKKQKDDAASVGVPVLALASSLGICLYQCNMLTYSRMPMQF